MTPQELKNSILQLAIQGKLVEQRPEEGTAAELLEKIARHGTTGTHGTTKTTGTKSRAAHRASSVPSVSSVPVVPSVPDDEKPFDIPGSWEWVHINQVAETSLGKTMDKEKNTGESCPYLCSINVYWEGISLEKVKEARFTVEDKKKYLLKKGDLLICEGGDVGRSAIWNFDKEMYYQNALHRVRFYDGVLPQYFRLIIECYKGFGIIERYCKGVTIKHLVQNSLYAIWFPLPPLAEQKRIVAKIEELLPLIDRYEKAWSKLEDFNRRFPVDMQKSVLQMAIQGKLVDQRPEEGTGEELYRQIQAEKQRLVKSGKIKKEKPLPEITEDEIPFEIPDSWMWTRLGEISWFFDAGKSPSCLKQPVKDKEWGVITTTSIQIGFFDETQNKVLPNGFSVNKSMQVRPKDILITRAGPMSRTGVACLVRAIRHNLILSDKTVRINMTDNNVYKNYIVKVLNSPQIRQFIINLMSGMDKQQVNISQEKFKTVLIPLPPLAEQERIVAKLEEILPLCERLK